LLVFGLMFRIMALAVLLVAAAAGIFRLWLAGEGGQRWLRAEVSKKSGFDVGWKHLSGPLLWGVDLDEPTLASRDGKLRARARRAELRWSLQSLLDGDPALRVRLVRPSARVADVPPFPEELPRRARVDLTVEDGPNEAHLKARWYAPRLDLDGDARVGGGRVKLQGDAQKLRVSFRDVEVPGSRDHMVLSGDSQVTVRGRRADFSVTGVYRHRRYDAPAPRTLPAAGTLDGGGTVQLTERPVGDFVLHLHDRGNAARLLNAVPPPRHVVLRGRFDRRLRIQLESQ
jgi:hypothetical protein